MRRRPPFAAAVVTLAMTGVLAAGARQSSTSAAGEWTHYGGNAGSQKYSPLDQITRDNVSRLEVAWRWASPDNPLVVADPLLRPGMYHDTPLMVRGVLYTVTSLGQIAAINPASGRTRWLFDPESWKNGRPGNLGFVHRGLAYWSDGTSERLLLGTADAYLIAVDAKTGQLAPALRRWRAGGSHGRRGASRARHQFQRVGRADRRFAASWWWDRASTTVRRTRSGPAAT